MIRPSNSAPAYIQFYPTLRCNLSCSFCFNRHLPAAEDARVADVGEMAAVCSRNGIKHIDFLGGEPTLHPALLELIEDITGHGLKITLSSNGTRPDVLRRLSRQFPRSALRVGISLNTDALPGDLDAYIRDHNPILKTVISRSTAISEAGRPYIGMPGVEYFLIYMDAAGAADLETCLSFEDFCKQLEDLRTQYSGIDGVFCGGFVPDTRNVPELANTRCPAGTTKLSVLPDGSVYPCYLLFRYPEFYLGNIRTHNFDRIWQHPALDFFRRFSGNSCPKHSCRFHAQCHGGCPAMSYMARGRLDVPDPRCVS